MDMTCVSPQHRTSPSLNGKPMGESLYASGGSIMDTSLGKHAIDAGPAAAAAL
jgi:hypothetical protein